MGESYHNNHHKFGNRANFGGVRWHEIDPTYQVIRLLAKVKVITLTENTQMRVQRERLNKAA
jgi:stearoyl-CoA desaturase (Delta-9 desaturase)